jgi:hypothetical protein
VTTSAANFFFGCQSISDNPQQSSQIANVKHGFTSAKDERGAGRRVVGKSHNSDPDAERLAAHARRLKR